MRILSLLSILSSFDLNLFQYVRHKCFQSQNLIISYIQRNSSSCPVPHWSLTFFLINIWKNFVYISNVSFHKYKQVHTGTHSHIHISLLFYPPVANHLRLEPCFFSLIRIVCRDVPGGAAHKNPPANAGDTDSISAPKDTTCLRGIKLCATTSEEHSR